jgi:hypothetical protein
MQFVFQVLGSTANTKIFNGTSELTAAPCAVSLREGLGSQHQEND